MRGLVGTAESNELLRGRLFASLALAGPLTCAPSMSEFRIHQTQTTDKPTITELTLFGRNNV